MNRNEVFEAARMAADDRKGEDIVALDLKDLSPVTDWFLIVTGRNPNHTRSVADGIIDEMAKHGAEPYSRHGYQQGQWILLDYLDFVVHIFTPEWREYYQLERLWRKA